MSVDVHSVYSSFRLIPHSKLFPALHRKLPTKGPTVTASSGNVGAVALEGGGWRWAGQLWRSEAATSIMLNHLCQAL